MDDIPLEAWFQGQMLRQEAAMDCGVAVFAKLANLNRQEILRDMPGAINGRTVEEWETYLAARGCRPTRYQAEDEYPLPCAHLVEIAPGFYHWIFQAEDGGIHDPDPSWACYPPRLMKMSFYRRRILTVAIVKAQAVGV